MKPKYAKSKLVETETVDICESEDELNAWERGSVTPGPGPLLCV